MPPYNAGIETVIPIGRTEARSGALGGANQRVASQPGILDRRGPVGQPVAARERHSIHEPRRITVRPVISSTSRQT